MSPATRFRLLFPTLMLALAWGVVLAGRLHAHSVWIAVPALLVVIVNYPGGLPASLLFMALEDHGCPLPVAAVLASAVNWLSWYGCIGLMQWVVRQSEKGLTRLELSAKQDK